jgi:hypothetical protein
VKINGDFRVFCLIFLVQWQKGWGGYKEIFYFLGGPGGDFYQHLVDWNMVCFSIKANFLLGI